MKKLLLTLFTVLTALQGWGIIQQTYTDPDQFPIKEGFEWTLTRYDYRGIDENGDPILVNTQEGIILKWVPDYFWTASGVTRYGQFIIENFYKTDVTKTTGGSKQIVNLDIHNYNGHFFQWTSPTTCTIQFPAVYFGRAKDTYTRNNTYGLRQNSSCNYAFVAAGKYENNSTKYWISGDTCSYKYQSGRECYIDLEKKTITIDKAWGCYMLCSTSGSAPSYVVEYFEKSIFREPEPTTLAWIEANGEKEKSYTIADRLMGVYAQGTSLWCKDLGNISNVKTEPATGAIDYMSGLMSELHQRSTANEWDQSNWVELVCDNAGMAASGEGKYIKAGTVKGKYTDDVNYTIRVTGTSLEPDGEATYEPNYYSPVNFMCYSSAEQDNTSVRGTYGGKTYYFVNPKVQEYAIPTIAVWRGNNEFAMAERDVESDRPMNTAGLPGAYKVQWDLNNKGDVSDDMLENEAYEFHAIVRRATNDEAEPASVPARVQNTLEPMSTTASADYEVWPLDLDPDNFNIVTEITAVGSDEPDDDGYYYTLTGQRVTNPAPGFYIHNGRKVIVR